MERTEQSVENKRRYCRYTVPLKLYVNKKNGHHELLDNISEGGACFKTVENFDTDDFVLFHFYGDANTSLENVKFSILGKIVWHHEINESDQQYGAKFTFYNDPFSQQQKNTMKSALSLFSL